MATYRNKCPHCGDEIVRHYGDMGEGLMSEEPCQCDMGLRWYEVVALILVMGLMFYSCSVSVVEDSRRQQPKKVPAQDRPLYRGA